MSRKPRESSATGIYHVMVRGINRQDIFEDAQDYNIFIRTMASVQNHLEEDLKTEAVTCSIYAYCLMPNHIHLLICEKDWIVGSVVKAIASRYVLYFNRKYGRIGHLFQDRFKSEPCNDPGYFLTLFRYIHQNPVKAGLVKNVKEYEYSSWHNDYLMLSPLRICRVEPVIKRYGMTELASWVDMPLPKTVGCIDLDEREIIADETVRQLLLQKSGANTIPEFLLYQKQRRKDIATEVMRELNVGPRQMVRVSGMTYAVIHKLWESL